VIQGIARIKTSKGASALAELMAQGTGDFYSGRPSETANALIGMGSLAEPAVLPLLQEKNTRTLIEACSVLRETGTRRSIGPLKELVVHPSKNVSEAAAAALRAIEGRRE
jgi:HEAT repeat protein